jgi:GAF domain-containing protein
MKRRGRTSGPSRKAVLPKARKTRPARRSTAHVQEQLDRALRERDEALEQQTATAEILQTINKSPGDLTPVFDAMVESAMRLCEADYGHVYSYDGKLLHLVAAHGDRRYVNWIKEGGPRAPEGTLTFTRILGGEPLVHLADISKDVSYRTGNQRAKTIVDQFGIHTLLTVPLRKEEALLGGFVLYRLEAKPFSDKQISLVQNFSAQAVIAMENARLLNELRESLQQQTATADVLKVISSSPGELAPVFQAMLENAVRICEASFGVLFRNEDGAMRAAAMVGVPPAFAEFWQRGPQRPGPRTAFGRVSETKQTIHIADVKAEPAYVDGEPVFVAAVNLGNFRTLLNVPMLKENELIGVLAIYRQEVRPFTDKQIELLQNFAAQAVIAIENTRLLNELRETLERQTATSDVLKVISSSPGELKPVFEAMLANATRICEATFGNLWLFEGNASRAVAVHGMQRFVDYIRRNPVIDFGEHPTTPLARVFWTKQVIHIPDLRADESYIGKDSKTVSLVETAGARTVVAVPMLKDDELVGAIVIYRQEVRPFTDKQIELLKNFAAQAVIAIENTRLLSELRESLEQQTATSDVLKVIASSTGELAPVFDAMLENATRICGAKFGNLFLLEGENYRAVAVQGERHYAEYYRANPLVEQKDTAGIPLDRVRRDKQVLHILDMRNDASYLERNRRIVALVDSAGARTFLAVPLLKDNEFVGAIAMYRQEVRPFTDKQIALVQNFAAQAVIAIENTRLLNELRQRTDDLTESLDQQTATSDVLQAISSSTGDVNPVFKSILQNATRICEAQFGVLVLTEGEKFRMAAMHGVPAAFVEKRTREPVFTPGPSNNLALATQSRKTQHVADLRLHQSYAEREPAAVALADAAGARTLVVVPMLKDNRPIGAIAIYRTEVRPFTNRQVELVTNFAAQAVIAIENTRLLNELRESLQQQTATADVLKVISRSAFNLQTVFDTLIESAAKLCEADYAWMFRRDGDVFHWAAGFGQSSKEYDRIREYFKDREVRAERGSITGRCAIERKVIHVSDVLADPEYTWQGAQALGGYRAALGAPLLRNGNVVGVIFLSKKAPQPFTEKQIELVNTFADQAVIAIENVRLFDEVQARTRELSESLEQQTATSEVLQVISSSQGDLEPVFQTLLGNATRLCMADFGFMFQHKDGFFQLMAQRGADPAYVEYMQREPLRPGPETLLGRIAKSVSPVQIADFANSQAYLDRDPLAVVAVERAGVRTLLGVPMLRDGELIGAIAVYRQEVSLFTEKQIELLTNFAAQAVIAIENTRLLSELRESLEQQMATSEVLGVISSSPTDVQPVFETIANNSVNLCGAGYCVVYSFDGEMISVVAHHNLDQEALDSLNKLWPMAPDRRALIGRTILEREVLYVADVAAEPSYTFANTTQAVLGIRSFLGVPMLREGHPIGAIGLYRREVNLFSDRQIELVKAFADQAVIAIENVRLFERVEARTRELAKSLEDLRNTQDRLVQTQKLASLGQLTAGIAHEIKNPLNFVNNFSGLSTELIDELQDALKGLTIDQKARAEITELTDTLRGNLDKVVQHGKRADAIVKNMLLHSREGSGEHRLVDINAIVEESLNLAYHGARAEKQGFNITMERSLDPAAGEVDLFPQDITRVLLNLISNGFYAATKRKTQADHDGYEPTLAASTRSLGDQVEIRIRDNGTGIPPEVKEKMFNPFFTTKPAGEGTGLGLSISHDIIVKQHGGAIEVDTEPGKYTEFRIVLPRKSAIVGKIGGVG